MATQYTVPNIPPTSDLDTLRLSVTNALSKLVGQLNGQDTQIDGGGQRIVNVATPTGPNDAVPLRYLKYYHPKPTQVSNKNSGGGLDAYTIVFSNGGTATSGNQSPPFVVGSDRIGSPDETWLAAGIAPSGGTLTVNFLHGTSVADCTHTMLATSVLLTSGDSGPRFQSNFNAGMSLAHGDVVIMKVINGAGAQDFSGGMVVRRT